MVGGDQVVEAGVGRPVGVGDGLVVAGEAGRGDGQPDPDPGVRVVGNAAVHPIGHRVRFSPNRSHEVIFSGPRYRGATPHFPVGWPSGSRARTS